MNLNLFADTFTRAEMLRLGGVWIECLNMNEDGVVYLPLNEPEELLGLQNLKLQGEEQ